jgi:alkaline phosphatase D
MARSRLYPLISLVLFSSLSGFTKTPEFPHGVAAGEVTPTSVILWTRTDGPATVRLEVFENERLTGRPTINRVLRTDSGSDFTLKADVDGLTPGTVYYYRWTHGNAESDTGTFRTPPLQGASSNVRFTFTGDSDGTRDTTGARVYGNFEVLDRAREDNADFFVYLGDTIYSDSEARETPATTLEQYRGLYKENRDVAALANLLSKTSTYSIWDDHEVTDDFDGQTVDGTLYQTARQAFFEYMPFDPAGLPADTTCAGNPLFRSFHWGKDVDVIILDGRSCRSASVETACTFPASVPVFGGIVDPAPTLPAASRTGFGLPADPPQGCLAALSAPNRTMLGELQKQLLKNALQTSTAKFKFVMNPVPIQQFFLLPYDRWEGYAAERTDILNFIRASNISNVIFLTTDTHANLVNEVFIDASTDSQPIAFELVAGPIATSTLGHNLGPILGPFAQAVLTNNAGVNCRHLDSYSYGLVEVNAGAGTAGIVLKNESGATVRDQVTSAPCQVTLGP